MKQWLVIDSKDRSNNYVSEHRTEDQARARALKLNLKESYIRYIVKQRDFNDGMSWL